MEKWVWRLIATGCLALQGGCATAPSRIPPPQFPSVSTTAPETRSAIFRTHRIQPSGVDTIKVGGKVFPLGDLPDYYHDSEFEAASRDTRFHTDNLIYGILMIGGFAAMDLIVRDQLQKDGTTNTTLVDAGAGLGAVFGLTWIIAALPSNPKDYIDRYNNYLGNRLGIGWDEQGR